MRSFHPLAIHCVASSDLDARSFQGERMVTRFGALVTRFAICPYSPREFVLRKFPAAQRSGRSSRPCHQSEWHFQAAASSSLDHGECLSSAIWGGHRDPSRLWTRFITNTSRLWFPKSRAFDSRRADAMEGNTEIQETTPSSCEEGNLGGGRYCVLLTGHASDYTQRLYGGYSQMFVKLLGDPQDIWDVYPVVEGVFPSVEDLERYDGFVLTGSRHDAHGSEEWISKLCDLLQSLHEKKRKMLGICFGHQVMSRALGGKTGRSEVGWEVGVRKVQLTDAMFAKPYAAGVPSVIRVYEVHRDQVYEIPPGGELLGFSERTGIEIFSVGDHVLAIQGHPEFTEDVVTDLIDSRLSLGILKEDEAKVARDSMKNGSSDTDILQQMCKLFLKSGRV